MQINAIKVQFYKLRAALICLQMNYYNKKRCQKRKRLIINFFQTNLKFYEN